MISWLTAPICIHTTSCHPTPHPAWPQVGVMHVFDAAQPALLYLVPGCLGAALLTAVSRGELQLLLNLTLALALALTLTLTLTLGELQLLLNYSEEKTEEQAAAEEKKGK